MAEQVPDLEAVESPPRRELDYNWLAFDEDPIGGGGQGIVYRAEISDRGPPDEVAVKEPAINSGTLQKDEVEAFLEEAATWETVDRREREKPRWRDSEHIVGVVDTGDDLPWIAMEYMDGGRLDDGLEANPDGLPVAEALWIGECVCRGVELAHNYGIAHLDLKPANILFRETHPDVWDVPKIADWGLARVLAERTGTMEGLSVQYAAPEQFDPEKFGDPDMLTDVYQVGALVYALLTGDPPYTGSQLSVMRDVVSDEGPVPPSTARESLPDVVDETVLFALETKKTDRYPNIKTFEQALRAVRTDEELPSIVTQRTDTSNEKVRIDQQISDGSQEQAVYSEDGSSSPNSVISVEWPTIQQNTTRTGVLSTSHHSIAGDKSDGRLEMLWSAETGGEEIGNPLVTKDTVYIVARENFNGTLYALDINSGEENWALSLPTNSTTPMTPMMKDGTVYLPANSERGGEILAIDTSSQEIRWSAHTGRDITSHPTIADGMVYVGSIYGLHAFDLNSGKQEWVFETEYDVKVCPTYYDGRVVVGSEYGPLYAFSASGEREWTAEFPSGRQIHVSAAATDGVLYAGVRRSYEDDLYAFDIETGNKIWSYKTPDFSGQIETMPVVTNDHIFITTNYGGTGEIHALDLGTRERDWKLEMDEKLTSPPTITTESVYVVCPDGTLYVCDRKSGTVRNEITVSTSDPSGLAPSIGPAIIIDDMLFIRGIEDTIFAFRRTE